MKDGSYGAWTLLSLIVLFGFGCGAESDSANIADESDVGEAQLGVTAVPTGVQCIRVVAAGSSTVSQNFTVTAGSSSLLALGRLPLGNVAVTASAFNVACNSIGTNPASWVSDPLTVTIRAGVVASLSLNLRQNNPVNANLNFVGNVVQIALGYDFSLFLLSDGTLRYVGSAPGQQAALFPIPFPGLSNVVEITAGAGHACARLGDGTVWCWGSNDEGQLGIGTVGSFVNTPARVTAVSGATRVVAGGYHTCALADGVRHLYCWGRNREGQLGIGNTTSTGTPTQYDGFNNPDDVYAGLFHMCLPFGASVYCTGANGSGQLGDGTTTSRTSFGLVSGNHPFIAMALGDRHTCGVRADNTVRCWGNNSTGQIGDGTFVQRLTPTVVPGISDATHIATGLAQNCVRRQSGSVSCWGNNDLGTLGDGTADTRPSPITVAGISSASSVIMAWGSTRAPLDDQTILGWGANVFGHIGDGTRTIRYRPVNVLMQ
jgi:alpha-tubulin suppressor-like RCC1 family protein